MNSRFTSFLKGYRSGNISLAEPAIKSYMRQIEEAILQLYRYQDDQFVHEQSRILADLIQVLGEREDTEGQLKRFNANFSQFLINYRESNCENHEVESLIKRIVFLLLSVADKSNDQEIKKSATETALKF